MNNLQRAFTVTLGVTALASPLIETIAIAKTPTTHSIDLRDANIATKACLSMAYIHEISVSIAILDRDGDTISLQRMDDANRPSLIFAKQKAMTSIIIKKPSKAAQDRVSQGQLQLLAIQDILPIQGGLPILRNGKLVGAIGVSGAPPELDEKCAQTGLDALQK